MKVVILGTGSTIGTLGRVTFARDLGINGFTKRLTRVKPDWRHKLLHLARAIDESGFEKRSNSSASRSRCSSYVMIRASKRGTSRTGPGPTLRAAGRSAAGTRDAPQSSCNSVKAEQEHGRKRPRPPADSTAALGRLAREESKALVQQVDPFPLWTGASALATAAVAPPGIATGSQAR